VFLRSYEVLAGRIVAYANLAREVRAYTPGPTVPLALHRMVLIG